MSASVDKIGGPVNAVSGGENVRRAPAQRLYLGGFLLIATAIVGAWLAISELRREQLADTTLDTNNLAVVLAAQAARSFQAVDLVLQEVQGFARASGARNAEEFKQWAATEEVHRFLVNRLKNLPQADAVSLIDETGRIQSFSRTWPTPLIDTSDRDFYAYWRDHDDPRPFIGAPVINKVTGAWVLTITRRIDGPQGEFRGIVLGVVQIGYFEDFYEGVRTEEGEAISLFRQDGTLLARHPHLEPAMGEKISTDSPWYKVLAAGGGTYQTPGYVGGVPRIISLQPVRDYPLAITVGIAESEALAPWRRQSAAIAIGTAGAVAGFIILIWALRTQFRRLQNSEARFRGFATTSSDWFWETDERHRISYMSEGVSTTGFGIKPRNLIGRTRREIATNAGAELEKWDVHWATLERHEPFRDFAYTWSNPGGEGTASISGDPVFDAKGRFLGYRGTGRDISAQIRTENALREAKEAAETANTAKSQFLANISHELRTPLNAIIGFSEMIDQGLAGPVQVKQREYTRLILQSGRHLLEVINDILDLARFDAGKFELTENDSVDLRQLTETCLALTEHHATANDIALAIKITEPLPLVVADPTRLKQILLNLISNAIKFTDPGGSIVVRGRRTAEGGVALDVEDTGVGMTEAEVEVALEPFGQVDGRLAREHEGTGLGLPLARRLIELHGGSLRVRSEKGCGTTVTVTLPASRMCVASTATVA